VQRRHNCSPVASFTNCVMTLYLLKVHLQTFLSIPITQKCRIMSCGTLVANERYVKNVAWEAERLNFGTRQPGKFHNSIFRVPYIFSSKVTHISHSRDTDYCNVLKECNAVQEEQKQILVFCKFKCPSRPMPKSRQEPHLHH